MKTLLLVYQMGKVGSTGLWTSLEKAIAGKNDVSGWHTHFLSPKTLKSEHVIACDTAIAGIRSIYARDNLMNIAQMLAFAQTVAQGGGTIKIITGTREPVGHALAGFFQNLNVYVPMHRLAFEEVANYICRSFPLLLARYLEGESQASALESSLAMNFSACRWFDEELKAPFGIDVYSAPFPHGQGYAIFQNGPIQAFVYRQEDLPRMEAPLNEFCSGDLAAPLRLGRSNEGENKESGDLYAYVKRNLRIPLPTLNRVLAMPYCMHFYTEAEREGLRAKYGKPEDSQAKMLIEMRQHNQALAAEVLKADRNQKELEQAQADAEARIQEAQNKIAALEAEILAAKQREDERFRQAEAAAEARIREVRDTIINREAEKQVLDRRIAALEEENALLCRRAEDADFAAFALRHSTSWRITRPLRVLKGRTKGESK